MNSIFFSLIALINNY